MFVINFLNSNLGEAFTHEDDGFTRAQRIACQSDLSLFLISDTKNYDPGNYNLNRKKSLKKALQTETFRECKSSYKRLPNKLSAVGEANLTRSKTLFRHFLSFQLHFQL